MILQVSRSLYVCQSINSLNSPNSSKPSTSGEEDLQNKYRHRLLNTHTVIILYLYFPNWHTHKLYRFWFQFNNIETTSFSKQLTIVELTQLFDIELNFTALFFLKVYYFISITPIVYLFQKISDHATKICFKMSHMIWKAATYYATMLSDLWKSFHYCKAKYTVTYYRPIAKLVVIVRRKCRELIRYVHMVTNEELSHVKFNYIKFETKTNA